jgi:alpha-L-arabinofuranosidase
MIKPRFNILLAAVWLLILPPSVFSQNSPNQIVINADWGKDTISRHIYGHFAEHLGRCIYDGFYVGDNNTQIPNVKGMRSDIVGALRKMKIPNLRWPGGCFADTYHWKDGIGDKSKRPTMVNAWWGGVTEDNSFGTHEFMELCEQLSCEPFINGNLGSGSPQEMRQWVEYLNHPGGSPMAKLRAENGRKEAWKVRFWGVGNENWGCGGNMKADYYANLYRQFTTYLGNWNGSKLFRLPSTANSANYAWNETLMKEVPLNMMDGVGFHHYSVIDWGKKGHATDFSEEQYFTIMQRALFIEELIQQHGAIMDKYDPKKRIAMVVDEWGGWYDVEKGTNPGFLYQQNTMRDAMIAGATLNIFNNHADRIRLANIAQTVNVLQAVVLTEGAKMILTPTYHVFEMFNVHHDAVMLPLSIRSKNYEFGKEKLQAVWASASRDKAGLTHISLVNIDAKASQDLTIDLRGATYNSVTGRVLKSEKVQDHNTFDNPNKIQPVAFDGAKLKNGILSVSLPPCSVVVLALK